MRNILICQHGGSKNHGCEALARTCAALFPDDSLTLYSYRVDEDREFLADVKNMTFAGLTGLPKRYSFYNLKYYLKKRLGLPASKVPITEEFKKLCEKADVIIAIGGDNYCYDQGRGYWPLDRYIASLGKPYVLMTCSIEPEDLSGELSSHLRLFDLITVRETISLEALKKAGIENAVYCCDPAFLLPFVPGEKSNTVGINLSPMVMRAEKEEGIIWESCRRLIQAILNETDMDIRLIPHVTWAETDDRMPLKELYEEYEKTGRVTLVPERDAMRLKKAIASCRFFVGARTHSTIAAYSAGVPTLCIGYSVKARGIARDLFGTEEGFVIPAQGINDPDQLKNAFFALFEQEEDIKARLKKVLPDVFESAKSGKAEIEKLLDKGPKSGCSGCSACFAACPQGAITMKKDSEGFSYPEIDPELCIDCGGCKAVCPTKKIYSSEPEAIAAKTDTEIRLKSSSGGAFYALAKETIAAGGTVFGAAFDEGFVLRHRGVSELSKLEPLMKSKYIPSEISVSDVKDALSKGPVLFCGTPCQAAAVYETLGENPDLVICQTVCHGVPSPLGFESRLRELEGQLGAGIVSYDFRRKTEAEEGNFVSAAARNGNTYLCPNNEDPYSIAYTGNLMLRPSCYVCRIRGKASPADITLGDLWGSARICPEFDDGYGISLLLIHTDKGRRLIEKSGLETEKISYEKAESYNGCLSAPAPRPSGREGFLKALAEGEPISAIAPRPVPRTLLSRIKRRLMS